MCSSGGRVWERSVMIAARPSPAPVYVEDDTGMDVGYDYRTVI